MSSYPILLRLTALGVLVAFIPGVATQAQAQLGGGGGVAKVPNVKITTAHAPVHVAGTNWSYTSEGTYGTVGTAVAKIKVYLREVNGQTEYIFPNGYEATLTADTPAQAGYVSSGSWSRTINQGHVAGRRYYSKAYLHLQNANGQPQGQPAVNSGWAFHE